MRPRSLPAIVACLLLAACGSTTQPPTARPGGTALVASPSLGSGSVSGSSAAPSTAGGSATAGPGGTSAGASGSGGAAPSASPDPTAWARIDAVEQPEGFEKLLIDGNGKPNVTCAPCHPPVDTLMTAVTDGPAGLVAVGWIIQGFHGVVWTSADGATWRLQNDFPELSLFTGVAANARRYVAVGRNDEGSTAWSSTDGQSWHQTDSASAFAGSPLRITAVVPWRDGFVAVGYQGYEVGSATAAFWSSSDGLTWRRLPDSSILRDARVAAVAAGPPGLVAVGLSGTSDTPGPAAIWTSSDGLTWHRVPDSPVLHDARLRSIAYVKGVGFVAVGENLAGSFGTALVSVDGRSWRRAPESADLGRADIQVRMYGVAAGGPGIVAVGTETIGIQYGRATVWTSKDGLTWSLQPSSVSLLDGEMNAVAPWGRRLLAVGDRGAPDTYRAEIWSSPAAWGQ